MPLSCSPWLWRAHRGIPWLAGVAPFCARHLGMNGSPVRRPVPSWEIIVYALTQINPCYVGGMSPCRSRSPSLGKRKQKRDCVLGAGEKAWPALFQGQRRWGGCLKHRSQPRAVPCTAGQAVVQAADWTPPKEEMLPPKRYCSGKLGFCGSMFPKRGK